MCHGERDDLVGMSWGEDTFNQLTSLGVTGQFHRFPNMLHELKKKELEMLYSWINSRVKKDSTLWLDEFNIRKLNCYLLAN